MEKRDLPKKKISSETQKKTDHRKNAEREKAARILKSMYQQEEKFYRRLDSFEHKMRNLSNPHTSHNEIPDGIEEC